MATIRASCGSCGDIELTHQDVDVIVDAYTGAGAYRFLCPDAKHNTEKILNGEDVRLLGRMVLVEAEPRIVELLVTSGCTLHTFNSELAPEAGPGSEQPPISYDDLIDFNTEINADDSHFGERFIAELDQSQPKQ